MKKILCFLAALMMLFGISAYAQDKTELYESLGIILPADTSDPLTRGDFARTAATLIPDAEKYSEELPFYDVAEDSKYYSAVSCLYANKIINGTGQNLYSPENNITSNEACAIIIRILGYDFMADGSYQNTAMNLGLLKGVTFNGDGTVSQAMARRIIFNALETDIGTYSYENGGLKVDLTDKASYLERCFGVYEANGVVSDNGKTSLYGSSSVGADNITIGDDIYKNESGKDYFACEVEAWYVVEDDVNIVKYMSLKREEAVVEFNARDIKDFENGYYRVEIGANKTKNYRVSDTYKIIYNETLYSGECTKEKLKQILIPEIGSVRLVDSDGNGSYDVIIVKSYETFVVSGTIENTKTIIDKLDITENGQKKTHSISLENITELDIKSSDGARRDFTNILAGEVVSVAMNHDKTYAEVIISEKTLRGGEVSLGTDELTIDGTEHFMTELYKAYLKSFSSFRLVDAEFYLDFEGNIAYHEMSLENGTVAYLISYYKKDGGDGVTLKVVTEDNELKKIDLAQRVTIDGSSVRAEEQYDKIASKERKDGYLINYRQNEKEEITKIDFPYYQTVPDGRDVESFHIIDGYENASDKLKSSRLGNALALETDTKVWIVPTAADESQITVVVPSASSAGANGPTLSCTAYSFEEYPLSTKYVVVSDKETAGIDITKESFASNQKPMIVKEIRQVYKNDEIVNCFVFSDGGQYNEVYSNSDETPVCKKSGKKIKIGDMIRYGTDKSGAIDQNQIIVMYSPEDDIDGGFDGMYYNDGNFDNATHTVNSQGVGILYGWINAKDSKYMELTTSNPATTKIKKSDKTLWSVGAMNVTVYNRSTKKVSISTTDEIMAYRDTGEGSKVVMSIYYDNPNMVYVIKED